MKGRSSMQILVDARAIAGIIDYMAAHPEPITIYELGMTQNQGRKTIVRPMVAIDAAGLVTLTRAKPKAWQLSYTFLLDEMRYSPVKVAMEAAA